MVSDLLQEVSLAGALDVLVMSVLIYAALLWVRRSRVTTALYGILIVGAVYLASTVIGLSLTATVLRGFFAVLIVALIVIFREELRRFFEGIARWSLRGRRFRVPSPMATAVAQSLASTLGDLARDRIGALVVLNGRDSLADHLRGGVGLDGVPSDALLKSIFDPHSAGHDGALVIENGRVVRFAAHLPLSSNFEVLAGHGTRHAAALGLTESCDCLCIVVSEERGTISLARNGELTLVDGTAALASAAEQFLAELAPRRPSVWREIITRNAGSKVAAILISSVLWLVLVYGAGATTRVIESSVVPEVASGIEVETLTPRAVKITLRGARRSFLWLGEPHVEARISVGTASVGEIDLPVSVAGDSLPADVVVESIVPERIRLRVRRARPGG